MPKRELVDLEVLFVAETDLAWGVAALSHPTRVLWVPKSQCELDKTSCHRDTPATLTIPEWLAIEKGLV